MLPAVIGLTRLVQRSHPKAAFGGAHVVASAATKPSGVSSADLQDGDRAAALAAGGLLAMLTNSLMPFAFERGKNLAGVATVVGLCLTMLNT